MFCPLGGSRTSCWVTIVVLSPHKGEHEQNQQTLTTLALISFLALDSLFCSGLVSTDSWGRYLFLSLLSAPHMFTSLMLTLSVGLSPRATPLTLHVVIWPGITCFPWAMKNMDSQASEDCIAAININSLHMCFSCYDMRWCRLLFSWFGQVLY